MSPSPSSNQVVILVPGTLGSELSDNKGNVWPGDWIDWVAGYQKIDRLLKADLQVGDIIRQMSFLKFYDHLIEPLNDCGYAESANPATLYVCPYDWRRALQKTTEALAAKVKTAREDHGEDVKIVLIGHSLGGLMCRYYLESGDYNTRSGYSSVDQLILMGVPNLGLPLMVSLARGDQEHNFLSADQVRTLMNKKGFSAAYLMFPATSAQKVWETGGQRPWTSYDLFSAAGAANLGLTSVHNLAEAAEFRAKLDGGQRPPHVRYFSFVGSRKTTYTGAVVQNAGETPEFDMDKIERPDGGDGTVPIWSAWLAGEQGLAVGGDHGRIFKDHTLREYLAVLLGCAPQDGLADSGGSGPQLDVSELSLAPGATTELGLRFENPITTLSGEIRVGRATDPPEDSVESFTPVDPIPLTYEGGPIRGLRLEYKVPKLTGGYRLELFINRKRQPTATTEFFVQAQPPDRQK